MGLTIASLLNSTPFKKLFSTNVPLRKNESVRQLLDCLDDIKAWMSLNFLSFNENKTEVMVFGGTTGTPLVDLGALSQYIKPTITNLGVKIVSDLKLNSQIRQWLSQVFFQLRQLAKIKPYFSSQHFETVIHAFVTTRSIAVTHCTWALVGLRLLICRWCKMLQRIF